MPQTSKSLSPAPAGIAGAISANERVAFDLCRAGAALLVNWPAGTAWRTFVCSLIAMALPLVFLNYVQGRGTGLLFGGEGDILIAATVVVLINVISFAIAYFTEMRLWELKTFLWPARYSGQTALIARESEIRRQVQN